MEKQTVRMTLAPSNLRKLRQNIKGRMKCLGLKYEDLPCLARFLSVPPIVITNDDAVDIPMPELAEVAIIAAKLGMNLDIENVKLRKS